LQVHVYKDTHVKKKLSLQLDYEQAQRSLNQQ
jgi:hypothetical protein